MSNNKLIEKERVLMNETFKTELAEFARDIQAICDSNPDTCEHCPLVDMDDGFCKGGFLNSKFDPEAVIAAVEAYRRRKKPCAEVIDKALDVYTIEVEIVRYGSKFLCPAEDYANMVAADVRQTFTFRDMSDAVRVLSAKRFVLESHKEEENDGD